MPLRRNCICRIFLFLVTAVFAAASGPYAFASTELFVVLQLSEPANITEPFNVQTVKPTLKFVTGTGKLNQLLKSEACKPDETGLKRCHLLETVGRKESDKCFAAIIDSGVAHVTKSDIRIGRDRTEEGAVRKAFFWSNTYNSLYFQQRLITPFRTITEINEYVFTNGEAWKDRYLGSACRK